MEEENLNKIVPESEDSASGYVELVDEEVTIPETQKKAKIHQIDPRLNGTAMKISLSQEQIRIKTSSSSSDVERASSFRNTPKIRLQSPIKSTTKSNKTIAFKDGKKAKDWSLKTICRLCENPFIDPRVLSCLHCFCLPCLNQMMDIDVGEVPSEHLKA